jgi:hypothetical protein
MNAHVEPTSAHAIYPPSSAHRWVACTASAEAIAALGEQEEGEEAAKGTAAHEELERVLKGGAADPDHAAAYCVALAVDYVKKLPPGESWIEQRVRLTDQIWGRCDVAHWHEESRTLTIVDMKNGFVDVDAVENEQLRIYGAGSIYTHGLPAKWVRYVVVQPNSFMPVPRVKQWLESADDLYAWAQRVARIPTEPKTFVAGEQCKYCPLFGRCEASRDILRDLSALIAGLMKPEDVMPAQRALFKACEKPIKDAFANAEKAWMKQALAGNVPPGMKLVTTQKHKAWADAEAARSYIVEKLGVDALDVPTPAQAIERGCPETEVNTMAPRPPGEPALAFESDKRPTWSPKTAAEMFKGVTVK